jgi:hypothetical protein
LRFEILAEAVMSMLSRVQRLVWIGLLSSVASAAQVVVPNEFNGQEGPGSNSFPFHTAACTAAGVRYQQIYAGGEVGQGTIESIRFRLDAGEPSSAFGPVGFQGVTVRLSSTSLVPDDLSQNLDTNFGADTTIVFQGALALQTAASAATPRPFSVVIPLTTPFAFDGASGDSLLLEIRITGCADFRALDFTEHSPGVSRAYVRDALGGVATARSSGQGLVTQFAMGGGQGACTPGPTVLCLDDHQGDHRFRATVAYQTSQGGGLQGAGHALSLAGLGVARGGVFWFFDSANPEMLLKVLDGCAINGHYWVFYAAGTNVGLTTTVTDTIGAHSWTRTNADQHAAAPVQDTEALPCDG